MNQIYLLPELARSEIPNQRNLTSLAMFFQTFSNNVPFYATNIRMIILVMVAIIGDDDD